MEISSFRDLLSGHLGCSPEEVTCRVLGMPFSCVQVRYKDMVLDIHIVDHDGNIRLLMQGPQDLVRSVKLALRDVFTSATEHVV